MSHSYIAGQFEFAKISQNEYLAKNVTVRYTTYFFSASTSLILLPLRSRQAPLRDPLLICVPIERIKVPKPKRTQECYSLIQVHVNVVP